jgi:predicted esterase
MVQPTRFASLQRVLNFGGIDPKALPSLALLFGCASPVPAKPVVVLEPPKVAAPIPAPAVSRSAAPATTAVDPPAVELPPAVVPGKLTTLRIPGHRPATVVHGRARTNLAMIYLHGICGQVSRIADWASAAADFVTTIAPTGNKACPESTSRFSWNQDIELIHQLIDDALAAVSEVRNGNLNTSTVVVFGYSQGASRAERLVERHPERYRWVILGGPPRQPEFERCRAALGLVLLVGTEEHQELLADVACDFTARGLRTHFDQFVGVGHGFFGQSAPDVIRRTLTWLDLPPYAAMAR